MSHITRRLKAESSLKPTDYMPLIKLLDSGSTGFVEGKDLLSFLDKHCKNNASDCTLDLKYMANFVEFKV